MLILLVCVNDDWLKFFFNTICLILRLILRDLNILKKELFDYPKNFVQKKLAF